MELFATSLIAGEFCGSTELGFTAFNVTTNQAMNTVFTEASSADVEQAITRAHQAFESYSSLPSNQRATFLRSIGEQILALGDSLVKVASAETGLPDARIIGERGRTINQLNMFAELLETQEYQSVIEQAEPNREPLPKPDLRLGYVPLGVVAVFGASNFPLAFSTAGGDTASALAAGCPVVMKAHVAHPGTSELVAQAILAAIKQCGLDLGVFSLIQGKNYQLSEQIVSHPLVKAVGFTGSERVGMILQQHINNRPEPIPFYGELGSVNPQFLLPNKIKNEAAELAETLVASTMMGQGQFCTSPGVWLAVDNQDYATFVEAATKAMQQQQAGVMLTPSIRDCYQQTVANWQAIAGVTLLAEAGAGESYQCRGAIFETDLTTYLANDELQQEVFGACALIVKCQDISQMLQFVSVMKGNLTATLFADDTDLTEAKLLANQLVHKVGRLIYNQVPTGVEVCHAMNHGGPFPASTDIRSTSVGSKAIERFRRPICYQNMPQALLPELLKD